MTVKLRIIFALLCFLLHACEEVNTRKRPQKSKMTLDTFFENITEEAPNRNEKNLLNDIYSKKALKVAIFLPISGAYSKIGAEGYEVVKMANAKLGDKLQLKIFDTAGRKQSMNYLYQELTNDDFDVIIGPIFNFETQEIAKLEKNIPIISLSNDKTIKSKNVITFGLSQDEKIIDAVQFFSNNQKKNFVAIFPNSILGSSNYKVFQKSVSANNGEIMRVEFYDDTGVSDVSRYVQKIVNGVKETTYLALDGTETLNQKQMSDLELKIGNANVQENYEKQEKRADVIFVSGSGIYLEQIAKILRDARLRGNLQGVSIFFLEVDFPLGDTRLFEESFFYSNLNMEANQDFTRDFISRNGKNPTKLAGILYDAIFYSVYANNNNSFGSLEMKDLVKSANKFEGVNGRFIINRDGVARRYGKIMYIKGGVPRSIDFSPQFSHLKIDVDDDKFNEDINDLD